MDVNVPKDVYQELLQHYHTAQIVELDDAAFISDIEVQVLRRNRDGRLRIEEESALIDAVFAHFRGFGLIDPYMRDPEVSEVMINRFDRIFYERAGEMIRSPRSFEDERAYEDFLQKLVASTGREVNRYQPIVDCRLQDGSRVNIVLSPISDGGSSLTIRRFRTKKPDLAALVDNGTVSTSAAQFLHRAVQAKCNIFISGGTSSGKTTLLNALVAEIPPEERLITIEDSRELNFNDRPNWVALESRRSNAAGVGAIEISDLIRAALRMRPDRIIVGEVRGSEALDMLQAFNTGHDGSFSTGHGNAIRDMQFRIETMVMSARSGLTLQGIRQQIASAIDLFVHIERRSGGIRRIVAISEVDTTSGEIVYNPLYEFDYDTDRLMYTKNRLCHAEKFIKAGVSCDVD